MAIMTVPQFDGQLPVAMSAGAPEVDWVYYTIFYISVAFTVAITAAMIYFVIKYRRKAGDTLHPPSDLSKLEILWTVAPIFFVVILFHIGFKGYVRNAVASPDAMEIRVHARQWLWEFEYPNGMKEIGKLMLPVNREIKMVISSDDVLHSFYIPAFRLKKDAVPGMYTTLVLEPNEIGDADVFCAEYCGTGHSAMHADVKIVAQKDFDDYMKEGPKNPYCTDANAPCPEAERAKWGEQLFAQNGCPTCHARDGVTKSPAPNLKGVFGSMVNFESTANYSGPPVIADENYVTESIRKPQAKIVKGFTTVVMPTFTLSDRQVDALVSYVKTIK